jgi:hypothetical protein
VVTIINKIWRDLARIAITMGIGCMTPFALSAADYDFQGVNAKTCSRWDVTVSLQPPLGDHIGSSEKRLKDPNWKSLVATNMSLRNGESTYLAAPCLFDGEVLIECKGALPFPLANATYRLLTQGKQDAVYECVAGCKPEVLRHLYDLTGENVHPSRYSLADEVGAYERTCARRLDRDGFIKKR